MTHAWILAGIWFEFAQLVQLRQGGDAVCDCTEFQRTQGRFHPASYKLLVDGLRQFMDELVLVVSGRVVDNELDDCCDGHGKGQGLPVPGLGPGAPVPQGAGVAPSRVVGFALANNVGRGGSGAPVDLVWCQRGVAAK